MIILSIIGDSFPNYKETHKTSIEYTQCGQMCRKPTYGSKY